MKLIFALYSLVCFLPAFSQEQLSYNIKIESSFPEMQINITREPDVVNIFYTKLDSIDTEGFGQDRRISRLLKKGPKTKSGKTDKEKLEKLLKLREKYATYQKGNLMLLSNENFQYVEFIDSIFKTDEEILNRSKRQQGVFVLDGTSFHITIREDNEIVKDIYVHAPGNDSYPLIYQLISWTLDLYRNRNADSFLEKQYTGGY